MQTGRRRARGEQSIGESTAVSQSAPADNRSDLWILGVTVVLLAISVLMVFSTTALSSDQYQGDSTAMVKRHLAHVIVGLLLCSVLARSNLERLYRLATPAFVLCLLLLVAVLIPHVGHRAGGAQRWLVFGPLRIQPGELAKFAVILYISAYIERNRSCMMRFVPGVLIPLGVVACTGALLLAEPDFGSTVVVFLVVFCQLLTVSKVRHLILPGAAAVSALGLLVMFEPYRLKRLLSFLDPMQQASGTGYQLVQSLIAVGSGGLTGAGLGAGKQKLFYLPAAHTDFIYAVIAEELGLLGACFVLLLFLILLVRGVKVAARLAPYPFLSSLAIGCTLLMVLPALLNMGVVLGILPTKGLVLPLVAYGGTAMIIHLAAIGVLLRLSRM